MKATKHFDSTDDLSRVKCHIAALLILQGKAPAHHTVLITTEIVWTDAVGTAATDGIYVYISPQFYRGLATDSQRAFLLAHEVSHIILRHPQRGEFYRERGFFAPGQGYDHHTYNRAADYVINADCIAMGLEPIPEGCYSDQFGRNDIVDNVYAQLVSDNPPEDQGDDDQGSDDQDGGDQGDQDGDQEGDQDGDQEGDQDGDQEGDNGQDSDQGDDGDSGDDAADDGSDGAGGGDPADDGADGSGSLGDKAGHDHHLAPKYDGTPEEQRQAAEQDAHELGEAVDDGLEQAARMGRSVSGSVQSAGRISGGNKSDTDWRAEIADLLRRVGNGDETTWARIHRRRYSTLGVISPSRRGALTRIGAIIDISSSVDRARLEQFMIELAASIDELNPSDGCLVMFTNHNMYSAHEVQSGGELLDLEVPEGGGTRMQSALDWAEANGFECDVMLCFTDGDLYGDDWERLAHNDVVVITDRVLPSIDANAAADVGARVIVAQAA